MRIRSIVAALVIGVAIAACQPVPEGGEGSQAAPSQAQSEAPASSAAPDASATPYAAPGY